MAKRWAMTTGAFLCVSIFALIGVGYGNAQDPNNDPADILVHGRDPDLRMGGDANNPFTYPFLPAGQTTPPEVQERSHFPHVQDTNLALGLPYRIDTQWPDEAFHSAESRQFPDRGQLTDGKFGTLRFADSEWVGLLRQYGRSITIDLGKVESIHSLSLDFLQDLAAGIDFPDCVTYYVSQDGVHFAQVGKVESAVGGGDYTPQSQAFQLQAHVNARYVRAQFTNKVFAFVDEFYVSGNKEPNPSYKTLTENVTDTFQTPRIGYLHSSDPAAGGVKHMMLAYTYGYGALGEWSEEDFSPMIAAVDGSGKPKKWLYDTVLMAPYGNLQTSADAWGKWISNAFTPGIQLSALDQSVEHLKKQLHVRNYKEKVVIDIPLTYNNPSRFGSLQPGAPVLNFNPNEVGQEQAFANKLEAIHWFIDEVMDNWHKSDFKNLELVGFYWEPEAVIPSEPKDEQLIQRTKDMVHRQGLRFYWIPYYGAPGVTEASRLGFDAVMIQPNVSFNWKIDSKSRFRSTAEMAKAYGMGIEMEAHWDVTSTKSSLAQTAQAKYFDYFTAGNVFGFKERVLKSYYLNSKSLVTAYKSTNPFYRRVYDNTVKFIEGHWSQTFS